MVSVLHINKSFACLKENILFIWVVTKMAAIKSREVLFIACEPIL